MEKTITIEKIEEISKTLKPLVRENDKLYSIEDIDPYMTVLTWEPKIKEEVKNIEEYCKVPFFSYSYPTIWKPSIAEVFVEIQDNQELIKECNWFEVVHDSMDLEKGKGNHGIAIFYKVKI